MQTILIVAMCVVGAPWVLFHYITQWKKNGGLSIEDENLLDELHDLARRLDDRMATIERIVAVDNPGFRRPETESLIDDREDDHVFDHINERLQERQRQRERRRDR
jgi:phage shock protein B